MNARCSLPSAGEQVAISEATFQALLESSAWTASTAWRSCSARIRALLTIPRAWLAWVAFESAFAGLGSAWSTPRLCLPDSDSPRAHSELSSTLGRDW